MWELNSAWLLVIFIDISHKHNLYFQIFQFSNSFV